jgi:hypothetical protein
MRFAHANTNIATSKRQRKFRQKSSQTVLKSAPFGLVSIVWQSRTGFGYQVQQSSDLSSWQDIGFAYGTGNEISLPVEQLEVNTGTGGTPPPPPANPPTYFNAHYTLRTFAGLNKTLVSWNQPGQSGLAQVLLNADSTGVTENPISSLPLFLATFEDTNANEAYRLSFSLMGGTFDSSFSAFTIAGLTLDEQERLSWFTERQAEVLQAMLNAAAIGRMSNGVAANGSNSGAFGHYRVVELYLDSDGDGILDHHEDELGTDPWLQDTDHDGSSDLEELLANTNPTDPSSWPGSGAGIELDPDEDRDEDGVPNGEDADPYDRNVDWERQGFPRFAVLPISQSSSMVLEAVNNRGGVVMNGSAEVDGPELGHFWEPGEPEPSQLPLGQLEITADLFSHLDESMQPVKVPVILKLKSTKARDISDNGTIVGEGLFEKQGTGGNSSSSTGVQATTITVALQWPDKDSTPELVHPGKVAIGSWGDILLESSATHINDEGVVMGVAEFVVAKESPIPGEVPFEDVERPCLWKNFNIGDEGLPLYSPNEDPPSPLPDISGIRRDATEFLGSYGSAAFWNDWSSIPSDKFPTAGYKTVAYALMPNGSTALAGDQRLMLRSYQSAWEPALRPYSSGFSLGRDGTVWTYPISGSYTMWQPLGQKDLSDLIGLPNLIIESIIDTTDRNVAIGESSNGGNVIFLPVVPLVGQEARQSDELSVAKFKGGELITTDLNGNHDYDYEGDPDRFHLTVCGLPAGVTAKVSVKTENLQGLASYNDSATLISLGYDSPTKAHTSEPLILVSDTDDDGPIKNSAGGADNSLDDPSHLIALGAALWWTNCN